MTSKKEIDIVVSVVKKFYHMIVMKVLLVQKFLYINVNRIKTV